MQDPDKLLAIFGGSFAAVVGIVVIVAILFEILRRYYARDADMESAIV